MIKDGVDLKLHHPRLHRGFRLHDLEVGGPDAMVPLRAQACSVVMQRRAQEDLRRSSTLIGTLQSSRVRR